MHIPLRFLGKASIQDVSVLKIEELIDLFFRLKKILETQDKRKRVLAEALKKRFKERARKLLN
ncbi:hypothetical protein AGMMS49949_01330 [Alphaproteobacteria bacterium]|nr:hypothetical protein AGMMS49949_01330 [Alphaproteobacteria bacterium]GHS95688.1 hypothetical protein AGMMS50296_0600 [Alphaproteobacteria bacterium]